MAGKCKYTNLADKSKKVPHSVPPTAKSTEELILEELAMKNISFKDLANMTYTDRTHMTRCLKKSGGEKRPLSQGLLDRINNALGTEFKLPANES